MKPLLLTLLFAILTTHASLAQWVQVGLADRAVKDISVRNSTLFAVTADGGSVFRSTDNGTNWTVIVDSGAVDVAIAPSGFVFVIMNDSLYRSTDNGNTWFWLNVVEQILPSAPNPRPTNVSISPTGIVFCGIIGGTGRGTRTCLAVSTNEGSIWSSPAGYLLGGGLFDFRDHSVITVGWDVSVPMHYNTNSQLSSDDGQTWFAGSIPHVTYNISEFPPGALGLCSNSSVFFGGGVTSWAGSGLYFSVDSCSTWTRVSMIVPECGASIESGGMLVGTDSLGVFLFSENGDSLGSRNDGLTNLNVHTLTKDNDGYAYAGTDNGVWRRPLLEIVTSVEETQTAMPSTFSLAQNYPNPFNPVTNFQFSIVNRQLTILKVYDVLGREVATLVNEAKQPGTYTVQWDASGVASGVYFYRLEAGGFVGVKKLLLLR